MSEKKIWLIAGIAFLLVIVFWIANWHYLNSKSHDERGTFGDMFGVSTSIFTGFTIIGLIVTILLQREDIRMARIMYENQEIENKVNKELILKEREETHFFQLMNFQQTTLNGITGSDGAYGRILLRAFLRRLTESVQDENLKSETNVSNYDRHRNKYSPHYFHFLNTLEVTLMFIHNSKVFTKEEKFKYINVFMSQLSTTEANLWAYYVQFNSVSFDLKKTIKNYRVFDKVNKNDLGHPAHYGILTGILDDFLDSD